MVKQERKALKVAGVLENDLKLEGISDGKDYHIWRDAALEINDVKRSLAALFRYCFVF
jgi:hypothetical protein